MENFIFCAVLLQNSITCESGQCFFFQNTEVAVYFFPSLLSDSTDVCIQAFLVEICRY